ncbi:hypothetical protein DPMN_108228 [Dreissena polymorpha]|uniref:Uncharacterized protein n=1 Tax=Dreissena polymorpha TaxID=45954 RepID=A0A9D4K8G9_DREPO|nr:hypothetical protein DPMN_108228 [Dreissena polymorpha]
MTNMRTVVKVLQVSCNIRKIAINATLSESCGNEEDTIVRKTANAKKTVME